MTSSKLGTEFKYAGQEGAEARVAETSDKRSLAQKTRKMEVVLNTKTLSAGECLKSHLGNSGAANVPEDSDRHKRIIFDITTSSLWGGAAVGIVRVEQELARALQQRWPGKFIYSLYDKATRSFYQVEASVATKLIGTDAYVRFDRRGKPRKREFRPWRHPRRAIVVAAHKKRRHVSDPSLFQRILHWLENNLRRPQDEKWIEMTDAKTRDSISFCEATTGRLELSSSDILVSAGLDWDHKDIDVIWRLKDRTGIKYIGVCYDMIPWKHPEFVVPGYAHRLLQYFIELAWAADLILCISDISRRDFQSFCEELMIPPPESAVFELGAEIRARPLNSSLRHGLQPRRFVLFVSTIEPRKNHRLLVHVWDYLVRNIIIPDDIKLVFAGRVGWGVGDLLHEIAASRTLKDRVLLLPSVSDDELVALYEACRFTLMPSFYEGYGLPVVESLSLGRMCVTSGRGALGDIGGDLVERIDPFDFFAWAGRLASLICDDEELAAREAAISSTYKPPEWNRAAEQFASALRSHVS